MTYRNSALTVRSRWYISFWQSVLGGFVLCWSVKAAPQTLPPELERQVRQGTLTRQEALLLHKPPGPKILKSRLDTAPAPPTTYIPTMDPTRVDWLIASDCQGQRLTGFIRNAGNRTMDDVEVTAYYLGGNGGEYVYVDDQPLRPARLKPNDDGSFTFKMPGSCIAGTKVEVTRYKAIN
ncbi:hypothetical protein [Candidatus Cyanaurora vandensis]|uniref:hypothetical protein n=1 Tax=Candidatus Cyanaurora vandensis TaxID=2714958 RepID=UPI00257D8E09|nr:hypothetical protein [Candidatus Cyanaurora vandensis]